MIVGLPGERSTGENLDIPVLKVGERVVVIKAMGGIRSEAVGGSPKIR